MSGRIDLTVAWPALQDGHNELPPIDSDELGRKEAKAHLTDRTVSQVSAQAVRQRD